MFWFGLVANEGLVVCVWFGLVANEGLVVF